MSKAEFSILIAATMAINMETKGDAIASNKNIELFFIAIEFSR